MREYPDPGGRFGKRLHYEDDEFELIMDEIRGRADLGALKHGTGVDVDRVVERVFEVTPDYLELPRNVLGSTTFHRDGRIEISISRELSDLAEDAKVARRLLRSTLAHECAHASLHRALFLFDNATLPLFGSKPVAESSPILCRRDAIDGPSMARTPGYTGEWWEYQANRGMSALLLPRAEVRREVPLIVDQLGYGDAASAIASDEGRSVVRALAEMFDIGATLTRFRLQHLGYIPRDARQNRIALDIGEAQ